jgi:hypothetical protein
MRRQETREQGRWEQTKTIKDSERARKRHTQIDMESVVSAARQAQERQQAQIDDYTGQRTAGSSLESGRELVVVDPSSDTTRNLQTPVNNQTSGRQERLEQERLEHKKQERMEKERLEQERLEQERLLEQRLERERLEQEKLEQEKVLLVKPRKSSNLVPRETYDDINKDKKITSIRGLVL